MNEPISVHRLSVACNPIFSFISVARQSGRRALHAPAAVIFY